MIWRLAEVTDLRDRFLLGGISCRKFVNLTKLSCSEALLPLFYQVIYIIYNFLNQFEDFSSVTLNSLTIQWFY
jgi:hypothetical protein